MTKYLAIAFLFTGFLVGDAYGEDEVYYCTDDQAVGFKWDEKHNDFVTQTFKGEKFKIKVDKASKTITKSCKSCFIKQTIYTCNVDVGHLDVWSCRNSTYLMAFNTNDGKYVRSSALGNLIPRLVDNIVTAYGTCDKFD